MYERASIGDIDLYYQTVGEGPAVVFLHGFGGNHLSWWQQVPAFSEYRCIAPDQRMFGRSEDTAGEGAAASVDDLAALLDGLDVDRAALVGHSMSGWTAASYATQYPDRVAALVLSGTPGGLLSPDRHAALQEEGEAALPEVDPLSPERAFLSEAIRELNLHAPAEFGEIRPTLDGLPLDADRIVDAGIPTFLIAGEADQFMPEPAVRALRDRLDGAAFAIVEGAGHSSNFDRPEAFNRLVGDFIDENAAF